MWKGDRRGWGDVFVFKRLAWRKGGMGVYGRVVIIFCFKQKAAYEV